MNRPVTVNLGFLAPLTLIFITLKLCAVIHWSWWWVLSPVWIPVGVVALLLVLYLVLCLATREDLVP